MELEDRYGIRVSEEEAAEIETVGGRRRLRLGAGSRCLGKELRSERMTATTASLAELFADAPEELRRQALSHSSWVETRTSSYGRLAFLGDSVLGLSVADASLRGAPGRRHRRAHQDPQPGRQRAGLRRGRPRASAFPRCSPAQAPDDGDGLAGRDPARIRADPGLGLRGGDRRLLSGARLRAHLRGPCVEAFSDEVEQATRERLDFKSELQERLARDGDTVNYEVAERGGATARPSLRGPRDGRRGRDRHRLRAKQEGGRAGRGQRALEKLRDWRTCVRARRDASIPATLAHSMYLKAINLKGFKSFPDRTRLTFSPGVSVIVGPNGSGKSNITDAVLWALGEQSPTAVRGQQMRDVIFAGGNGQSPRRFAEVEVVIDNTEGRAASEFSEISISRRIERNGDGEYRLNGARCRLVDIVEALADTNMGREAHSVISQGKVEQIVNSKPRDRRLLIEEAAGLGKHRKRRHNAQLKLDRTRDNLERALDVEREARSRLRPLKRQAEAAERTAKLERQTNELRARVRRRRPAHPAGAARQRRRRSSSEVRATRDSVEKRFEEVRARRTAIEERIASGEEGRRRHGELLAEARAATERVRARAESLEIAERDLRAALGERQLRLEALETEPDEDATAARIAELEAGLAKLGVDASEEGAQLRREADEAERARAAAKSALEPLDASRGGGGRGTPQATQMHEMARAEAQKASERRAALAGELAAVEAKLAAAAVEGEHEALAGLIETGVGLERAVSAVLGERLRASIVGSAAIIVG